MAGRNGIPGCECELPRIDARGNVLRLQTCPACQIIRLDRIRGGVYAGAYVKRGDTVVYELLKQKELFGTEFEYSWEPSNGDQTS